MSLSSRPFLAITALAVLSGCMSSGGPRTDIKVGYYNVKGTSFAELDREIALHGPVVEGVGKAIAATRVRMIPDIRFETQNNLCSIATARVRVKADVTLPRLTDRRRVDKELGQAFSNIEEYARLHEAVHVQIADEHAEIAEQRIVALKPQRDCDTLSARVTSTFKAVMAKHDSAQQAFDAREQRRFGNKSKVLRKTS